MDYNRIFDSATRLQLIIPLLQQVGLDETDVSIIAFLLLGNTAAAGDPTLPDILKKLRLPKQKAGKYSTEKLKRYLNMIGNELKAFDSYGVLRMDTQEIVRFSKNHKFMTIYGMHIIPATYRNMVRLFTENPDYAISVLLGIYEALGTLLEFLDVK